MKDKVQTLDFIFQNCMPKFSVGKVKDWLEGKKIYDSIDTIRNKPLEPSHVKVWGFIVNNRGGKLSNGSY